MKVDLKAWFAEDVKRWEALSAASREKFSAYSPYLEAKTLRPRISKDKHPAIAKAPKISRPRISKDKHPAIVKAILKYSDASWESLSEYLGVSLYVLWKVKNLYKLPPRRIGPPIRWQQTKFGRTPKIKWDRDKLKETVIRSLKRSNKTYRAIAEHFDITLQRVQVIARQNGIGRQPRCYSTSY